MLGPSLSQRPRLRPWQEVTFNRDMITIVDTLYGVTIGNDSVAHVVATGAPVRTHHQLEYWLGTETTDPAIHGWLCQEHAHNVEI